MKDRAQKINLRKPPDPPSPRFHSTVKMQPAGERCAGCRHEIRGDDWVIIHYAVGAKAERVARTVHNTEWCREAAHLRILLERAERGILTGREWARLQSLDGTSLRPGQKDGARLAPPVRTMLARQLFPT